LSPLCPLFVGFKTWKQRLLKAILHKQIFIVTVTMQIRKKTLIILVILTALLLIVSVYIFFNRRIQAMETERQAPHSENFGRNPSINIKS